MRYKKRNKGISYLMICIKILLSSFCFFICPRIHSVVGKITFFSALIILSNWFKFKTNLLLVFGDNQTIPFLKHNMMLPKDHLNVVHPKEVFLTARKNPYWRYVTILYNKTDLRERVSLDRYLIVPASQRLSTTGS